MASSVSRSKAALGAVAALTAIAATCSTSFALTGNTWTGSFGASYNSTSNWSQGRVPNSGDEADIYTNEAVLTSNPVSVGGVLVGKFINPLAGELDTNGFRLTCLGTVAVDNGASLSIGAPNGGTSLSTVNLALTNSAIVGMASNAHTVVTGSVTADATSLLFNGGTMDVTNTYTNNGTFRSNFGGNILNAGTFTLVGTPANIATIFPGGVAMTINAPTFNLHDPDTTIDLSTANSNLTLNGQQNFAGGNIGSTVTIGSNSQLNLPGGNTWQFGYYQKSGAIFIAEGSVNLNGGATAATAAKVNNYAYYYTSVNVSGFGNMLSGEFDGASSLNVASGGNFTIGSPYFRGSTFSNTINVNGPGTVVFNGDMAIGLSGSGIPYTTVAVNAGTNFDWNGTTEANGSCTIQNGELDIYTNTIDIGHGIFDFAGYHGNISVSGDAKLNVAGTAWTMWGSMTLGPGAVVQGQTLTFDGSFLAAGNYSLYPTYNGTTFPSIQAPTVFNANTVTYLGFNGGVHLDGPTTWNGGTVISAPYVNSPYGVIVQNGNATVTADTTLFCSTYDMDGSANNATWSINANITLTQQAWYLDPNDGVNNPFHSTININGGALLMETHSGQWTLAGGTLNMSGTISEVAHDKLILGMGSTIGTINVDNNTFADINGGLEVAATSVAGGNQINASGFTEIQSPFVIDANAVLSKSGPAEILFNAAVPSFGVGSVYNDNGGTSDFANGIPGPPNLTINASGSGFITFNSVSFIKSLHLFSGGKAALPNSAHATLFTSNLVIDGGAAPTGGIQVADNKLVVEATISHNTVFTTLQFQALYGATHLGQGIYDGFPVAGYGLAVMDNAVLGKSLFGGIAVDINSILISRELFGDANADGKVDLTDLSTVLNNFGSTTGNWTSGNFDGAATIDLTDLSDVLNNFGQTNPNAFDVAAGGRALAAPEPASIAALILAAPMPRRRKR